MYLRYFLWNFVGRQDDIQASEVTITNGNWLSGVKAVDELYLGPQDHLPREMESNRARNRYFFLPFILGLMGLIYQLNRDQRNFAVVMWLFVMMGIALVVYFNSSPAEVRERDYVYAGSFYGTLRSEVERIWAKGHAIVFDIDVQGGVNLKKIFGNQALSIFIQAPSVEILRTRLVGRGTDTEEAIERRVAKAASEMEFAAGKFDYTLINDDLQTALAEAENVVKGFLSK